jgi:outer membrane protein assembly factor BamB
VDTAAQLSRIGILIMLAALITGCAAIGDAFRDSSNIEPPEPLTAFEPSAQAVTLWRRNVGRRTEQRYLRLRPAALGDTVYAAGRGGDVSAYDVRTGEQRWRTDTDTRISGGPGVGDGLVVVGTSDGEVLALSTEDGALAWRRRVSSEVLAAPAAAEGVVVVRTQDGKLVGMGASDGERLWVYDRAVPALSLRGTSTPVIAGGSVIAGFDNGLLAGLALKNGQLLWENRIAIASGRSELERLVDIDADPVVADGFVYVVTFQGRVAAVDRRSGDVAWRRDMSSYAGLGVDRRSIYVTDSSSFVWALDRGSSASVWRQDQLARRDLTPPVVLGDHVAIGDFEGYVHFLDRDDGRLAARVHVDGDGIASAPLALDELLLVYGRGGTLTALRLE